jgi:Predicted membrane protein
MTNPQKPGLSDNSIGAMAYFTPIPALFFLTIRRYNKRPYVRFHAWQSVILFAFAFLFGYLLAFVLPFAQFAGPNFFRVIRWVIYLLWGGICFAWIWCVVGALNGKSCKLPVIGDWVDEQAYR